MRCSGEGGDPAADQTPRGIKHERTRPLWLGHGVKQGYLPSASPQPRGQCSVRGIGAAGALAAETPGREKGQQLRWAPCPGSYHTLQTPLGDRHKRPQCSTGQTLGNTRWPQKSMVPSIQLLSIFPSTKPARGGRRGSGPGGEGVGHAETTAHGSRWVAVPPQARPVPLSTHPRGCCLAAVPTPERAGQLVLTHAHLLF